MWRPDAWLLVSWLALAGAAQAGPAPDPRWQEPIAQAVASVARQDQDAAARVEALRDLGRGRREELLVQMAIFLERAEGTEQTMGGALVLRELAFTPREMLDGILPRLGEADPRLRHVFTEMLSTIDRPDGGEPDFRLYEETIRARKDAPPGELILYMYEVSPDAALATMERLYGAGAGGPAAPPQAAVTLRELRSRPGGAGALPAGDLGKGREAVERLSHDLAWWRRLYAASVSRAEPALSTPEVASRLARDPDPLVRRVAGTAP
jgi:hypothetical protein